ncbi:MAG: RnfH family protein [Nitrococcus mobilis]|nr:RnfH family protein [Nitrococcus mobilis]
MSREPDLICVEVAYATAAEQVIVSMQARSGITVAEAIHRSGIRQRFGEIDLARQKVGIFSRPVELTQRLRHKDRVEIYRPLLADPKEMRRRRAARIGAAGRASSARR